MRRTAHILLHDPHAGAGLDIEPAGIKGHPLADQREARMGRVTPFQLHEARLIDGGPADGVHHRIVLREQFLANDRRELRAEPFRKIGNRRLNVLRAHIGGRRVHEVAQQGAGIGLTAQRVGIRVFRDDKLRGRRLFLQVAIKPVRPVGPTGRNLMKAQAPGFNNAVRAFWQLCRQARNRERILALPQSVQHMGELSGVSRHQHDLPGCPRESLPFCEGAGVRERIVLERFEGLGGVEEDVNGARRVGGEALVHGIQPFQGEELMESAEALTDP